MTHRGDTEVVGVLALCEVGKLGHPVKLLVQLLQQGRGVEHLALVGLQQIVVPLGQLLRDAQGVVQLLPQLVLGRIVGRAVCPGMGKPDTNEEGKVQRDQDINVNQLLGLGPSQVLDCEDGGRSWSISSCCEIECGCKLNPPQMLMGQGVREVIQVL